jgi:phage terminase small subunit
MQEFWAEVSDSYDLEEPHLTTLTSACEQMDIADRAGELLRKEDLVIKAGTGSLKVHPAVQVQRQAHETALKLLRFLQIAPPEEELRVRTIRATRQDRLPRVRGSRAAVRA